MRFLRRLFIRLSNSATELTAQGNGSMIRRRDLILCSFFVGLTLSVGAQQSTPAASAPAPLVGTLAGHPD
jgi:hypothetical protein